MVRFLLSVVFMFVLVGSARGDVTAAQADFDGSGVVDIPDFLQFVNAFGSSEGDDNFDAKFDLDGSGVVDIADFLAFVDVFGQTVQDTGSVDGDRAALIEFYNATGGDNWTDNTNWLSDKPLREWYGVGTNEQGRVFVLSFDTNQLLGSIPASIGDLTKLISLDLRNNQLTGYIPASIGNLIKLTYLDLPINQLSGSIPESIGNLTNLTRLTLGHNQLLGSIPASIGNLTELKNLDLGNNQLSGSIPASIGNLTELKGLGLGNNQLSGSIPASIGNLTKLTWYLFLDSNRLSGPIPPELGNLTNLEALFLDSNRLSGPIPPELGNLTNLERLYLYENQLSGSIPLTFQNLTNIVYFFSDFTVCLSDDPDIKQWLVNTFTSEIYGNPIISCRDTMSMQVAPIESWPPKADLIRQLENLGWFSVSFENADDFDHWHVYAIFKAVQMLNDAILEFPSHISVPMKLSVKRSYEASPRGDHVLADSGITFYPSMFRDNSDYTARGRIFSKFGLLGFKTVMIHEIVHGLGIHGRGNLYTKTADALDPLDARGIFTGVQANLKYKELKGNRGL